MGISCSSSTGTKVFHCSNRSSNTSGIDRHTGGNMNTQQITNPPVASIGVHWTYIGLPVFLNNQDKVLGPQSIMLVISLSNESVLEKPFIDWGQLKVKEQVPEFLPADISTDTFAVLCTLQETDSLNAVVTVTGFMDRRQVTGYAHITNIERSNPDTMLATVRFMQVYMNSLKTTDSTRNNSGVSFKGSSVETGYESWFQNLSLDSGSNKERNIDTAKSYPVSVTPSNAQENASIMSRSNIAHKDSMNTLPSELGAFHRTASNNTLKSFKGSQETHEDFNGNADSSNFKDEHKETQEIHDEVRRNSTGVYNSWFDMHHRSRSSGNMRRLSHRRRSSDIMLSDSSFDEKFVKVPKVPKNSRLRKRSFLAFRAFREKCAMTEKEKRESCHSLSDFLPPLVQRGRIATSLSICNHPVLNNQHNTADIGKSNEDRHSSTPYTSDAESFTVNRSLSMRSTILLDDVESDDQSHH